MTSTKMASKMQENLVSQDVPFTLLNNAGSAVFQSTTTDSSGYYQMDYITGGSYRIGMDVDSASNPEPSECWFGYE